MVLDEQTNELDVNQVTRDQHVLLFDVRNSPQRESRIGRSHQNLIDLIHRKRGHRQRHSPAREHLGDKETNKRQHFTPVI